MNTITKRKALAFLSCVMALLMLCTSFVALADEPAPTVWDGTVAASFAGGSGTEADPYQIASGADLAFLAKLTNEAKEFYLPGDGSRIETVLQGEVSVYTGTAKEGNLSYTYYVSTFGGKTYMTSTEDVEWSYPLQSFQSVSYRSVKLGGVTYYTLSQPAENGTEQAYTYDAETMEFLKAEGIEIGYKKIQGVDSNGNPRTYNRFFIAKDFDESLASTYPTSMGTISGGMASYTNQEGKEDQALFLVGTGFFSRSAALLNSITVEGVNYAWLADGTVAPRQSVSGVANVHGNLAVTYGDTTVDTTPYSSLYYALTADILLNDTAEYEKYNEVPPIHSWTPIGTNALTPFTGSFDGRGHEISGLYMKAPSTVEYAGLFGYAVGAEFANVTLSKGYVQSYLVQGALVGFMDDSCVTNIANSELNMYASKYREGGSFAYNTQSGGIVGIAKGSSRITDCSVQASISAINTSNSSGNPLHAYAGGIVSQTIGSTSERVVIAGCSFDGTLYARNGHGHNYSHTGGIVAATTYTDVSGNVISGVVEVATVGYGDVGGVVANSANSAVTSNLVLASVVSENGTNDRNQTRTGGIVGNNNKNTNIHNNVFAGELAHKSGTGTAGVLTATDLQNDAAGLNNFYVDPTGTAPVVNGAATTTEIFKITAEHLAGTATDVIAAGSTYADTSSLAEALNRGVYGLNLNASYTWNAGADSVAPFKPYTALYTISVEGTANGAANIVNTTPDMFPAGFETSGYALGETIVFSVTSADGFALRSVEYSIGGGEKQDLAPTPSGFEFEMPAGDVVLYLNFVETGADVYKVNYVDCEDVAFWSSFQYDAHFKGYETKIPNPTRYGYHFRGWLVNDSTTPVMNLVLGGNDYTADITLTPVWEAKTPVAIDFATQSYVYNAAAHDFVLRGAGAGLSGISVTYFVEDKWTTKAPTVSGTYKVRLVRAEDSTYAPLDVILEEGLFIDKAPSSIVITNADRISKTYDNSVATAPLPETVGDGTVSFVYYKDGVALAGAPKDAGSYTVEVIISEGVNFKRATVTLAFEITKAVIGSDSFFWSYDTPLEYNATEQSVYLIGVPSDIVIHYEGVTSATNAGEYFVRATFTVDDNNYTLLTPLELTWQISRASLDDQQLSWSYDGFVYDGTEKAVTVLGLPADVQVKLYTGNKAVGAGTYTASVVFEYDSSNYESVTLSPLTWTIDKATYSIGEMTWSEANFVFDGSLKTVTLLGVPANLRVEYSGNSYVTAGEYVATAIFFGDAANYNPVPSVTFRWSIDKADALISATLENKVIFDGRAHLPAASLNHSEALLNYDLEPMTEIGTYWYTITAPATMNYKAATKVIKLTITQTDADLLKTVNACNEAARNASCLREMFENLRTAYNALSLIENKSAADVLEAYQELNLTASVYSDHLADVEKDMETVYKVTFYVLHNQHPNETVKALVKYFVLKDED